MERLQKVIAESGYCSRRKAEEYIKAGKVSVNGEKVTEMGIKVSGNDDVMINGTVLSKEDKEYYLLYKPRGVISASSDDKGRTTVVDLIHTDKRIYPVGRLDYDTTGVLFLTNDGEFANLLTHPSHKVEKLYIAKVKGEVTKGALSKLRSGVLLDGKKTSKARAKLKNVDKKSGTAIVELIISEGKNHQVKRMMEAVGLEVVKLKREQVGFFNLSGLASGEYRMLTPKEVKRLRVYALEK